MECDHRRHLLPLKIQAWVMICLLSTVILPMTAVADEGAVATDYPKVFRFGLLNVLPSLNHKDAQVVIEMNFLRQNREQFPGIEAKLEILSDVASAVKMFQQERLHGISLTGLDFLSLREKVPLDPLFIASRQDTPLEAYVLLALESVKSIDYLSNLRRRRLIMENFGESHIGQVWLDTVLWEQGHSESKTFFTSIRKVDKPTRMVLPVFFGQAEACLVPESVYATMAELNPQIGRRLKVLMRSPDFVRSIHCTVPSLSPVLVDAIKRNAINMAGSVDGRQFMMIFQLKRHFLYEADYMKETERIYRKYKKRIARQ